MENRLFDARDKRQFDRKQLVYYLKVLYHDTERIAGYLGDISSQGLMLFSKEKMPIQQVVRLRINRDNELGINEDLIFDARSLWAEKDVNPEYNTIGFEFIGLNQNQLDSLKKLIRKYGFGQ